MMKTATATKSPPASLDGAYALVKSDLAHVDALILTRVKNDIPLIGDIARHIVASGGKRIRPALTLLCSKLCHADGTQAVARATAVEFIHTATLLHDDVVDESKLRRGLPTANEAFGNKASILVGDFLLSQAFQLMVEDGNPRVLSILANASAIIAQGELMQLLTEGELKTTAQEYLDVVNAKTSALFAAACELGAVGSSEKERAALRDFGTHVGMAFQLIDDMLDYGADETRLGKSVGDDFREGKITLPVILAFASGAPEEKQFWNRTLADLNQTPDDFAHALALLQKHGTLETCAGMARNYCAQARTALAGFAPSPAKSALADIVDFCASRAY